MNSVKTVAVVAVFLGVVYGVYQVINNSEVYVEDDTAIRGENGELIGKDLGKEIDTANMSEDEIDAALFGEFNEDDNGGSEFSMDIGTGDDDNGGFNMNFDTGSGDDEFGSEPDSGSDTASFGGFEPSTPEKPPTQPKNLQPSIMPAASRAVEAIQEGTQAAKDSVEDTVNSFGQMAREKNAEFTSKASEVADAGSSKINNAVNDVASKAADAIGFGSFTPPNAPPAAQPNSDFNSQPTNPVQNLANSFSANADAVKSSADAMKSSASEIRNSANNSLNEIPDFTSKAAEATQSFSEKATENVASIEKNAMSTATSAFANAANNFLTPKTVPKSAPKPTTQPPAKPVTTPGSPPPAATASNNFRAAPGATPAKSAPLERANLDIAGGLATAKLLIEKGKHREALETLTRLHNDERLSASDRVELLKWLDPLAGKVIYSTEHLVMNGYAVRSGDTLEKIAAEHHVSTQLLYNINRVNISNPRLLTPGTVLKIVKGPFGATVDRSTSELTLFLGDLYAGRFVVSMGDSSPKQGGRFSIKQKSDAGYDYIAANGTIIASTDPANPYGKYFLQLDNGTAIHSTANTGNATDKRGSISLSPIDAEDVFGILTAGSQVVIR